MKRLEDTGLGLLERTLPMMNALKNVTTEANLCRINATLDVESRLKDGIKAFFFRLFHIYLLLKSDSWLFGLRYHVPRSWFKPSGNELVIFEEKGGYPTKIKLSRRKVTEV